MLVYTGYNVVTFPDLLFTSAREYGNLFLKKIRIPRFPAFRILQIFYGVTYMDDKKPTWDCGKMGQEGKASRKKRGKEVCKNGKKRWFCPATFQVHLPPCVEEYFCGFGLYLVQMLMYGKCNACLLCTGNVSMQLCSHPTNEVTYFRALSSIVDLPTHLKPYVPLFCDIVTK